MFSTELSNSDTLPDGRAGAVSKEALLGLFLARLRRLLQQRADRAEALNAEGIRLLDQAIFSTYCDCRALGGAAIASGLVQTGLNRVLSDGTQASLPVGPA